MTVGDIIGHITELRGQQYDTETLTAWLSELEGQIVDEVINLAEGEEREFSPFDFNTDWEKQLAAPARFMDVYTNYLMAKIDFHNQESERYNNDVVMYQAAYDRYCAWYIRTHKMKKIAAFSRF